MCATAKLQHEFPAQMLVVLLLQYLQVLRPHRMHGLRMGRLTVICRVCINIY